MRQIINTPSELRKHLLTLDQDKKYVLKDYSWARTISQNSYLHAVFSAIWIETWNSMEDMKDYLKDKYLKDYKTVMGVEIEVIKKTSKLKKNDFSKFADEIKYFAYHELGMKIPHPDDVRLEEFRLEYWLT